MKRIICTVLAVLLVAAPFAFLQSAEAADAGAIADVIIEMLWETLKSWGIHVIERETNDFNQNIEQWMNGELIEYLAEELNESFNYWITGMDWMYDNFGHRILNSLGLEKFYAFTTWLRAKYNITNNSTINPNPNYILSDCITYLAPVTLDLTDIANDGWYCIYSSGSSPVYVVWYKSGSNIKPCIFSAEPFSYTFNEYNTQGQVVYTSTTPVNVKDYQFWYANVHPNGNTVTGDQGGRIIHNPYAYYTKDQVIAALGYNITPGSSIEIVSGNIVTPGNDPSYTPGDAIIYYDDGSIAYVEINWPSSVSVDNLPSVISPTGTQDPGFDGAWAPVRYFVNTFSESIGIIRTIVYGLPEQVMVLFYFIMSVTVVFGAIHLFKEH